MPGSLSTIGSATLLALVLRLDIGHFGVLSEHMLFWTASRERKRWLRTSDPLLPVVAGRETVFAEKVAEGTRAHGTDIPRQRCEFSGLAKQHYFVEVRRAPLEARTVQPIHTATEPGKKPAISESYLASMQSPQQSSLKRQS